MARAVLLFRDHHYENQPRVPGGEKGGEWTKASGGGWEFADNEVRVTDRSFPEWVRAHQTDLSEVSSLEREAIEWYTHQGHHDLNRRLREGVPLTAEQSRMADALNGLIEREHFPYPERLTVWRGINMDGELPFPESDAEAFVNAAEYAESQYRPGAEVELGGFQSTSYQPDVAIRAAESGLSTGDDLVTNPGVIFEIRVKSGFVVDDLSLHGGEDEILLPPTTKYRVRRVLPKVRFASPYVQGSMGFASPSGVEHGAEWTRTVVQLEQL